jgi:CRP-like cAMP-binding protein
MHTKLIELIRKFPTAGSVEEEMIIRFFEPVNAVRGEVLEKEGTVPRYLYFIVSGIVRQYKINEQGDEITTHLNCPPGFITSYTHYAAQTISDENTVCVSDCTLLRISHTHLQEAISGSDAIMQFSRHILTASLAYNEQRTLDLTTLSATERYQKLLRNQPELVQQVPVQYLASFLGIHPESLSRIRRQIIS